MPWIPFTADHVKARISPEETAVYNGDEQLGDIIGQVADRFRGAIAANPGVTALGPAGTLPSGVIYEAAVIARTALIGLPPVQEGMTDPRREEFRAAQQFLERIPSMQPAIFSLDDPEPSIAASYGGAPLLDF